MSKNKALGKGFNAFFDDVSEIEETSKENNKNNVSEYRLSEVKANPDQPRKHFNEDKLEELVASVKANGILQPILLEQTESGFIVIAGERRYRAAKRAGLETIPAIVRKYTHEEKLEIALIENIQREDLSPVEEALAYKNLINELNISQEEAAERVGKKRSTIANSLRLLKLPENILNSLDKGDISSGHARALLSVINPSDQEVLFNRIRDNGLSVRETESMSGELNKGSRAAGSSKKGSSTPDRISIPELQSIHQKFIDVFGTKIQVKGNLNKGKIEINYYSKDDLERIYEIIDK